METHLGSRTGAQIRSHAQKFFIRLSKEAPQPVDHEHSAEKRLGGDFRSAGERALPLGRDRSLSHNPPAEHAQFDLLLSCSEKPERLRGTAENQPAPISVGAATSVSMERKASFENSSPVPPPEMEQAELAPLPNKSKNLEKISFMVRLSR